MSENGDEASMKRASEAGRVLVTGGTGYLAGWMIVGLLRRGFRVRTTVRKVTSEASVRASIRRQVDADDRLSFAAADLTREDGWSDAVAGCDFVLHVASPMGQGLPRDTDLLGPAREGSLRVLRAAAKAKVSRVVVTSSIVASLPADEAAGATDETVWTDPAGKDIDNYSRSKTLAERAAWEFMASESGKPGFALTTILPGMILGPVMTDSVSGSVEVVERLLNGKVPAIPRMGFAIVDVRDLVDLHLKAMSEPAAANERFVAVSEHLWLSEIAGILREHFGVRAAKVPRRAMPDFVVRLAALVQEDARFIAPKLGKQREFSSGKAKRLLGWRPRPARASVLDSAESLFERHLAGVES
jgi:dihydroflavonol-4-reductase